MAEHPHAALVRKGYEAFSRGDMDTLRGLMTADCTQHVPGSGPLSGDFKGQDAIIEMYGRLVEETGGTMRVELRQTLVDGRGHVVALHHTTAQRGGKTYDMDEAIVFRIVGDKASDLDQCVQDIDQADAFWA
ncbi:nuclear transport factor 2 family protein [Streptomyces justiciae]|uniref:Nuclear transport factor 2 family protein n=1 Tax=Streptomyces justiciae TaxID=2780140 RepID=A0ABU3LT56_9ACTN|nr:nuclear transport factor 2 family protein [Streptomyces justiciae]MBE8469875.1 nuclear transport factor 2 family protein [Streptomyces justiciae]MCW8381366.1 nuclear transport factor 2 family protein [Streptomyces justiciae]MDT7842414.1 nuclear transport factor 2 family protein [Streptomyces justiciae]